MPPRYQIIHEDDDLLVVDKPPGMLTSTVPREKRPTLLKLLRTELAQRAPRSRLGLIHRLDRDASGLLVFSKNHDAFRALKEQFFRHAVQRIYNVRSTVNEVAVALPSSLSTRSNDSFLTTKVKATFVDAKDIQTNAFKVVTERGNVYLMGRVTEREATRASDLARTVSGVQKVVRVFEIVTEAELAEMQPANSGTAKK